MGSSYHQFCPVAKAMELLDERWTLLIVRELNGDVYFGEKAIRTLDDGRVLAHLLDLPRGGGGGQPQQRADLGLQRDLGAGEPRARRLVEGQAELGGDRAQVVLGDLFIDMNYMSVPRVDRCQTCHRAIDHPGFESKVEAERLSKVLREQLAVLGGALLRGKSARRRAVRARARRLIARAGGKHCPRRQQDAQFRDAIGEFRERVCSCGRDDGHRPR